MKISVSRSIVAIGTWPGLADSGNCAIDRIAPAMKMPRPPTIFWTKKLPEKNTPSDRLPVRCSDSSTTSESIDAPMMNALTSQAVLTVKIDSNKGSVTGACGDGNSPIRRRI